MKNYKQGDIVVVFFPFADKAQSKKRPALVISNDKVNNTGDYLLMQITSKIKNDALSMEISDADYAHTPLPLKSFLRIHKIFILNEKFILSKKTIISHSFVTTHLIKNPLLILCVLFLAKTQCSQSFKNAKLKKIIYNFFHCVLTADLLFERYKLLIIEHFYLIILKLRYEIFSLRTMRLCVTTFMAAE